MIVFSLLITVAAIGAFASVMIWLNASRSEEASGKPDPIVEVQKIDAAAESGSDASADSGTESERGAKSEAGGNEKSSDEKAELAE